MAAQRGPDKSLPGMWEFPGGKVEDGETPEQSLRRELLEELHCRARVGQHVTTTEHQYPFGIIILDTYLCTLDGDEPQLTEHTAIRWMAPDDLMTLDWAPADIPAVCQVQELLGRVH